MNQPRLIVESQFALECRALPRSGIELLGQQAYLLVHPLQLKHKIIPTQPSLLVNPNETLRLEQSSEITELLLLRLAPALLLETATRLKLYRTGSTLLFSCAQSSDAKLQAVFEALHNEMLEAASGWREVIQSLVQQLVVYVLRKHVNLTRSEELELSRVGIVDRRLRRAMEFMHDNCARELTLTEIAASVYISEFHFARLFKKLTGTTPHAYLAALRIERARKLLAETDLAITEVGARVGYSSQSHFTKIFREATGYTPNAFRAALAGTVGHV
jgi:AraC-like DNA-binding protein